MNKRQICAGNHVPPGGTNAANSMHVGMLSYWQIQESHCPLEWDLVEATLHRATQRATSHSFAKNPAFTRTQPSKRPQLVSPEKGVADS